MAVLQRFLLATACLHKASLKIWSYVRGAIFQIRRCTEMWKAADA
jgi:hypothetical protein